MLLSQQMKSVADSYLPCCRFSLDSNILIMIQSRCSFKTPRVCADENTISTSLLETAAK